MAKCQTCGETNLKNTDICGEHCIYCAGTDYKKTLKATNSSQICTKCGKEVSVTHNNMCYECYSATR